MTVLKEEDNAGVVAPPPLIFGFFLILGIIADYLWPVWSLEISVRVLAFLGFAVPGGMLAIRTFPKFRDYGTTANPNKSVSAIIRNGPFQFTRNPLYVSLVFLYVAIALGLGGIFSLLVLAPVLAIMHFGVILREESYLERKFGQEYLDYKGDVRRWI